MKYKWLLSEILLRSINLFLLISMGYFVNAQNKVSTCTVDVSSAGATVAPICRGQQIEEFNHQFQGGLYAQLITNPSFEEVDSKVFPRYMEWKYTPLANWELIKKGSSEGKLFGQTSAETVMLNTAQGHCLKMSVSSVSSGKVGVANGGYWGIKLENNTIYKVSFWAKRSYKFKGNITAALESNDGDVYAESKEFKLTPEWQHFSCELKTEGITEVSGDNRFVLYASSVGDVYFDVVTVMPPTWKNRPNGLRPDLAEKLAALKLKFLQFPGGCDAEASGMDTIRDWKHSIGPLEERRGATKNRWDYKNELYFGLDEFFQLCKDLGAEPIYTVASGVCAIPDSDWGPYGLCPLDDMQSLIENTLDLLEYCNGPASSEWGGKRAKNGHPEPYNLKYIEIGNENGYPVTAATYRPRYAMIRDSVHAHYPGIKIMFNEIYNEGEWADYFDQHFYRDDLTSYYNYYDTINMDSKICVAEYASSMNGNGGDVIGNFGDALADAIFMLGCEKNSEKMWWTGYGNYAGLLGNTNFGPCMVWNDAVSSFVTPSYYMQKILFAENQGTRLLPFEESTDCYWSTSIDTNGGKNDLLLKVVNNKENPENVAIRLKGVKKVNKKAYSTYLTGEPNSENSLSNPDAVVPIEGTFTAKPSFNYTFPAYSITVLRIAMK